MGFVTRRRVAWGAALLAAAAVAAGVGIAATAGQKTPAPRMDTASVVRGDVVGRVKATGTLSALVTVQVGSQVSGRLQQILVDFNSPVKKGEVVARLDHQLYQAALEQARANFAVARGNLSKARVQAADAKRQLGRTRALAAEKLVAPSDLDTAQANADMAQAQVEAAQGSLAQAQASLRQAEVNLAYTTIVSPIDGVVISRNVDVGQTVAAAFQAPTLFTIAEDLRKMQVDTSVAEADVGKLQPGMQATFAVDAFPGERFEGTVRQIRKSPTTVQSVVTYDAVLDVANPDLKLMPGMTANVTFLYARHEGVLKVPNAALRFQPSADFLKTAGAPGGSAAPASAPAQGTREGAGSPRADRRTLWVLRDGTPTAVAVTTGITDGAETEVAGDGLREGDQAIVDASSGSDRKSLPRPPGPF